MTRSTASHSELIAEARMALVKSPPIAIEIAEELLRRRAGDLEAWLLLGNAGLQSGDFDLAVRAFRTLLERQPGTEPLQRGLAMALNARGARWRKAGNEASALQDFAQAVEAFPAHPQAAFNAGLCAAALGVHRESRRWLDHHLTHHASDLEAQWLWFDGIETPLLDAVQSLRWQQLLQQPVDGVDVSLRACVLARFGEPDRVLAAWAMCDAPQQSRIGYVVADRLRQRNECVAARGIFAATAKGAGLQHIQASIAAAMTMPLLPDSVAHIAECRAQSRDALRDLQNRIDEWDLSNLRLQDLAWSNFYLAYHGEDDIPLQREYAQLLQDMVGRVWPHWQQAPGSTHPRKVVLLSSFWRRCTVGVYFAGWIDWLRDAGFEVVAYQLGPQRDAMTDALFARASRGVFWEESHGMEALVAAIRDEQAALLIYPELGMDTRIFPLAALRLARRQVVAWGHPVTTGFRTLDGYFTCAEMEPDHASMHYSERLLPLPGLGVAYSRPAIPAGVGRSALGLPEQGTLMLMPQSLFKVHPQMDALMAEVLAACPQAHLVLFDLLPQFRQPFERRLHRSLSQREVDPSRLIWLPGCDRERYLQINMACDVMLDTLHFSGGNTSLDALQTGLPVLSSEGTFMRGRQTAAMLRRLGLDTQGWLSEPGDWTARLPELLQPASLSAAQRQVQARLDELFDAEQARCAWLNWIEELCEN